MIVKSITGEYEGFDCDGIIKFLGIPYALPPVGDLRFRRAKPVLQTNKIIETKNFPPKAPQPSAGLLSADIQVPMSEDCLYLHVWTKSLTSKKPVLVFLHGGAFVMGEASAKLYDGQEFMNNGDIVFVSIQYRLGIFGFTCFRMLNETNNRYESNCGLSDQIEALKWIQNNIKAFGGDPNQITVMGESAGASSILALMVSPLAKGLFQQAILQSPVVNIVKSKENADFWAKRALHHLKVDSENCEQLQAITTKEALMASEKMMLEFTELTPTVFPFGPVIDEIIPYSIEDAFSKGLQMQIPLIIGTNKDEVSTFIRRPDPWFPATEQQLKTLFLQNPKWNKTNLRSMYKELTELPVLSQFGRDLLFAVDNYNIAFHHSKNNHVYRYQFDFVTSVAQRLNLGAFHGSELPFVFHNLDSELRKIIIPDLERAKKIADYVHFAWISFIKHDFSEIETLKLWEKFTPEHPNTLRINVINQLEEGTDQKIWEFWYKNR